jgi:hypothetical protein
MTPVHNGRNVMAIMVIAGGGQRATIDISDWDEQEIAGVRLACEVDGFETFVRTAR